MGATAAVRAGPSYPAEELERLWQTVLLQQFHDILPGSSIAWVHRDAERNYAAVERGLEAIIAGAAACGTWHRQPGIPRSTPPRTSARACRPWPLPAGPVRAAGGVTEADGGYILDNGIIRAVVDANGLLASLDGLRHRARGDCPRGVRQPPGAAPGHAERMGRVGHRRVLPQERRPADGGAIGRRWSAVPVRKAPNAVVAVERWLGSSPVTQRISLAAGADSLAIATAVDWHESEKLLKLGFPLDVRADRSAAETQFGHVFRPTHTNTSWEAAKFEICAHRWIHVAEPGYGVAISNESTYGHDVTRNVREDDGGTTTTVRVSLLRAPKFPDPGADQGRHELQSRSGPGASIADAVEEGYRTNLAPRLARGPRR